MHAGARHGERGAIATTELAALFAVVMFLLMLFVQLMLWGQARNIADAAAEEGAEAAADAEGASGAGEAAAESFARAAGLADVVASVVPDGDLITVTVTGRADIVFPGSWRVEATAQAPIEQIDR